MKERFAFLQKLNPDDILNLFLGLERRQQLMALAGIGLVLLLLLMVPSYLFSKWLNREEDDFMRYQKSSSEFFSKASQFGSLRDKMNDVQKNLMEKNASLKVLVEKVAKEQGIGSNIKKVTDINLTQGELFDEVGVDTSLSNIPLDAFLKFVDAIEQRRDLPLKVSKLMLRADQQNKQMLKEASLVVSTIKPKPQTFTSEDEGDTKDRKGRNE